MSSLEKQLLLSLLPDIFINMVLPHLPVQSVVSLSCCCKAFSDFQSSRIWELLSQKHWGLLSTPSFDLTSINTSNTNRTNYLPDISFLGGNDTEGDDEVSLKYKNEWKSYFKMRLLMDDRWHTGKCVTDTIKLYDDDRKRHVSTVTRVQHLPVHLRTPVSSLRGLMLVALSGTDYGELVLMRGKQRLSGLRVHGGLIWWFSLVDTDLVVSCGNDGAVSVVDIKIDSNKPVLSQRYSRVVQEKGLWAIDANKQEDIIVAGSCSQNLYILKLSTGDVLHNLQIPSGFYDIAIVGERTLACPTASMDLIVIQHRTGEMFVWTSPTGGYINIVHPVKPKHIGLDTATPPFIIAADSKGKVTGFDATTLQKLWILNGSDDSKVGVSDVVVFQNKIYAAVNSGALEAKESEKTEVIPSYVRVWDWPTKKKLHDIPISKSFISRIYAMDVSEDKIVIGGGEAGIYIVELQEGDEESSNCVIL